MCVCVCDRVYDLWSESSQTVSSSASNMSLAAETEDKIFSDSLMNLRWRIFRDHKMLTLLESKLQQAESECNELFAKCNLYNTS